MSRYITSCIIHSAATPNGKDFSARNIDSWHRDRGFKRQNKWIDNKHNLLHIGYHFVIRIDGSVELGRQIDEIGAHHKGKNANSIGICLIGTDHFTLEQWSSLRELLSKLAKQLKPFLIYGHNEFSTKTCPGFDVQEWLDNRREPLFDHILEKELP